MVEPKIFSVGQINRYIKNLMENDFILSSLLVRGEISNFKSHSSGHLYFTLKDASGSIACVMFRQDAEIMPFVLENGMSVVVYGRISLFEKTGQYQLYAEFIEPQGVGTLQVAFEQLKTKLSEEGLFDADFKREIPSHVSCIGVITSPTGAAVRDIIQIAKRRDPRVKIVVYPTLVQGEAAEEDIVNSIRLANASGLADVLIVGRGGGSVEDLWAFNEESVARAIFASEIPIISAVGHETDFTIADFVADMRAPTPSAAAELATSLFEDEIAKLSDLYTRLYRQCERTISDKKRMLDFLVTRPTLKRPLERIQNYQISLENSTYDLNKAMTRLLEQDTQRLQLAEIRLSSASPLTILQKGYLIAQDENNHAITSVNQIEVGSRLRLRLKDGEVTTAVLEKAVLPNGKEEIDV